MNPFNEQNLINKNNNLSSSERGVVVDKDKKESGSVDSINQSIENIEKEITLTTLEKINKTQELLQQLKEQENLWQELSEEEKNAYKSLSPEEKNEYLKLNSEEKDFYLNYPQLRDKLLEKKIELFNMTIGEKTLEQIQTELDERGKIEDYDNTKQITVRSIAQELLDHSDFKISKEKKDIKLIKLSVADLGFSDGASFKEIIDKGKEMGLDICPAEAGPLLRLDYEKLRGYDQPKREYIIVAMDTISASNGDCRVFEVSRYDTGQRYLSFCWANPGICFDSAYDFLFVRK